MKYIFPQTVSQLKIETKVQSLKVLDSCSPFSINLPAVDKLWTPICNVIVASFSVVPAHRHNLYDWKFPLSPPPLRFNQWPGASQPGAVINKMLPTKQAARGKTWIKSLESHCTAKLVRTYSEAWIVTDVPPKSENSLNYIYAHSFSLIKVNNHWWGDF